MEEEKVCIYRRYCWDCPNCGAMHASCEDESGEIVYCDECDSIFIGE